MTADYSTIQAKLAEKITYWGQPMELSRTTGGGGPLGGGTTTETWDCKGIQGLFETEEIDGTSIMRTDLKVMLAAEGLPVTPRSGDRLVIDDVSHTVISNMTGKPGTEGLIHVVQVRT